MAGVGSGEISRLRHSVLSPQGASWRAEGVMSLTPLRAPPTAARPLVARAPPYLCRVACTRNTKLGKAYDGLRTSTGPGGASPQAGSSITCTISIDNPHKSTHVPTTVNVVSHWNLRCDRAEANTRHQAVPRSATSRFGTFRGERVPSVLNGNAAASCVNGQYLGEATGTVVFPLGYNPPSGSAGPVDSGVVPIGNC